ncbi:hypothetical protein ADIAL_0062 [Alkalibacterium sp. AK22]|uniref:hypothetical protein n=1 Tax=Alkalibacterium sp. AK22 TaxID=1229520 RepID=UPI000453846C|nr:hypothetical protein [Alkalibacterium sp. AK22]EXJ24323.1 hypothetical protein ADIAL_0062 [Alkalibacterium sp. AK22]
MIFKKKPTMLDLKVGYYSYQVLAVVLIVNIALNLGFNFQWAETATTEYFIILIASVGITMIVDTYNEALHQTSSLYGFYVFGRILLGTYFVYQSFAYESPFVVNGLLTVSVAILLLGLMFILLAVTDYVRSLVDKVTGN